MTPYLLAHPNPHAKAYWAARGVNRAYWGYPSRTKPIQGIVMHVPVVAQDVTGPDPTAENVARYFATTDRAASAHVNIDADSTVVLLPTESVAFHAKDGNASGIGIEQGWGHLDWGRYPERDEQVLIRVAEYCAPLCIRYQIPLQKITGAVWRAGAKGFVAHSDLDPNRRRDPGPNYPWKRVFDLIEMEILMLTLLTEADLKELKNLTAELRRLNSNGTGLAHYGVRLIRAIREPDTQTVEQLREALK